MMSDIAPALLASLMMIVLLLTVLFVIYWYTDYADSKLMARTLGEASSAKIYWGDNPRILRIGASSKCNDEDNRAAKEMIKHHDTLKIPRKGCIVDNIRTYSQDSGSIHFSAYNTEVSKYDLEKFQVDIGSCMNRIIGVLRRYCMVEPTKVDAVENIVPPVSPREKPGLQGYTEGTTNDREATDHCSNEKSKKKTKGKKSKRFGKGDLQRTRPLQKMNSDKFVNKKTVHTSSL